MTTPDKPAIPAELVERMVALVRGLREPFWQTHISAAEAINDEAKAIIDALPKPIDPDLIEARKVIAEAYGPTRMHDGSPAFGEGPARVEHIKNGRGDEYWEVQCVVAGIKRGRELERSAIPAHDRPSYFDGKRHD